MATWATNWHALKNASIGKKAFALGGAIGLLSSFWQKLSAENLEVLLAIGALGADGRWIPLKQIRERLPLLTPYQLTRNLSSLSASSHGIPLLSAPKPSFIRLKTSTHSNREKDVALTRTGMIAINRAIQTLSAGFDLRHEYYESNTPDKIQIAPTGLLSLTLYGKEVQTGERASFRVHDLISLGCGGSGKVEATFDLAAQAISQGATVYWISAYPCESILHRLFSYADANMRSHAFYVYTDNSRKFSNDTSAPRFAATSTNEVFSKQAICFRIVEDLGDYRHTEYQANVLMMLKSILAAAEQHKNISGGYVALEGLSALRALLPPSKDLQSKISRMFPLPQSSPTAKAELQEFIVNPGKYLLKGFDKAGIKLHLLDKFDPDFMQPEVEAALIDLGFSIAIFGEDALCRAEFKGRPMEGVAAYRPRSNPDEVFIVQLDYTPPPLSKQVIAANLIAPEIPVPV